MRREKPSIYPDKLKNKETKSLKDILLNKWTALVSILAIVVGVGLKLGEKEKTQKIDEIKNELKLEEKDLPDNPQEVQEAIDAIDHLRNLVKERGLVNYPYESEKEEPPDEECKIGERVVKDTSLFTIVEKPTCDEKMHRVGGYTYITYDKTLPDEETATDENYRAVSDYLEKNLPNINIERKNPWEYKVSDDVKDEKIPKWQRFTAEK